MELRRRGRLCNATLKGSAFLSTPKTCGIVAYQAGPMGGGRGGNAAWGGRRVNGIPTSFYATYIRMLHCLKSVSSWSASWSVSLIVVVYSGGQY